MLLVKDFKAGDQIVNDLLVVSVTKGVNANHAQYLSIEFRDASNNIVGKKWDSTEKDETIFVPGNVVRVAAEVIDYKDALQLKVFSGELVALEDIDVNKFVKAPPISKEELITRFNNHVESVKNPDCRKILDYFIKKYENTFFVAPAAVSIHHEYSSGLLMHIVTIADICKYLGNIYKDINMDLLITGALLHDVGKMVEMEGPIVYKYTLEGKLLGHISIMNQELAEAANKLNITSEVPTLLEHMILSHHGQHEYGSPVLPLTKEALILSLVDNLDCKVTALDKALEITKKGEFTAKIFSLDNRCFYNPKD